MNHDLKNWLARSEKEGTLKVIREMHSIIQRQAADLKRFHKLAEMNKHLEVSNG